MSGFYLPEMTAWLIRRKGEHIKNDQWSEMQIFQFEAVKKTHTHNLKHEGIEVIAKQFFFCKNTLWMHDNIPADNKTIKICASI